jgi:hypothetical protein
MKWRYGIVKYYSDPEMTQYYYGIGEVYFDNDPNVPNAVTENPVQFVTETDDDSPEDSPARNLFVQLELALKDIQKYPIVDIANLK